MKNAPALNPYQQSIVDTSKKITLKRNLYRWGQTSIVALLCYGFILKAAGTLPSQLDGWLMFGVIAYTAMNWFGAFCTVIGYFVTHICTKTVLSKDLEIIIDRRDQIQKIKQVFTGMIIKSGVFSPYSHKLHAFIDITVDWTLFVVLITANHPILAFLHGGALVIQYRFFSSMRKDLLEMVTTFEDPLDAVPENIDDLMDKLCDPEADQNAPREQ